MAFYFVESQRSNPYVCVRWGHRSLAEFKNSFKLTHNATWNEECQWHSLFRNRRTMWNIMITRRDMAWSGFTAFPTHHPCHIFISKGSYKFWSTWTWEGLQIQKSFRAYNTKNHEVLTCPNHCPRRSLLPGIGHWCHALYVLLQSFTNPILELRNIYFQGGGPDVRPRQFTTIYVAQLHLSLYSRTWNVSPTWSIGYSSYIETLGRPWWLDLLWSPRRCSRKVSKPVWKLWPCTAKLMSLNAIKLRPWNSWCLQGPNCCAASRLCVLLLQTWYLSWNIH